MNNVHYIKPEKLRDIGGLQIIVLYLSQPATVTIRAYAVIC